MPVHSFETESVRMEMLLLMTVLAPVEDANRIMEEVGRLTPLRQINYDSVAFQSAPGIERYRPLAGAVAGAEIEVRKRPGVVALRFELPDDQTLLEQIVERVYQVHSYQEQVIWIQEALASRIKGRDDKSNPHRWWNTTGDWKKSQAEN